MRLIRARTTPRRRLAGALAAALLTGLLAPPAEAAPWEHSTAFVTSADGTVLFADVFRPSDRRGRVPVVLLVSPYLDSGSGRFNYAQFPALIDKGYAIVQVSLRGYSGSGGCGDFGGVGEQADVKASVEWAASQPWSTGRVGMWGVSYDAWTQVMALATKPKGLAATLIQSPLTGLYRGLYMNGAHYGSTWWATPAAYASIDLPPPDPAAGTEAMRNALLGTATGARCYAANQTETANFDATTPYWTERDLVARARTSTVPVLWSHGFADANTKPDNLTSLYPLLKGPKRAWVGQFAHSMPTDRNEPDVHELYVREAFDWLDAYVKRDPAAVKRVARESRAVVQQGDGWWRRDDGWAPRDAKPATFALRSGTFVDDPTNDGSRGHDRGAVLWTFSQPLPYAVHLSGAPRVSLTARGTGPAQVVVKVYDVDEDGAAFMVTRGVHAFVSGSVAFDLYPQDWRFERGHRIGIAVLGSDGSWWSPLPGGGQVSVSDPALAFPALRYDRGRGPFLWRDDRDSPPQFVATDAVVAAGEKPLKLPPRMRRR